MIEIKESIKMNIQFVKFKWWSSFEQGVCCKPYIINHFGANIRCLLPENEVLKSVLCF